ncbi:MAG: CGGC domain-containing protein [Sedimentisphaerales bacterium]|nr:CGGC domain-containing protein [Sedimentisphaerales bacterium]
MYKTKYIVVLQCDIVKERCSGYLCEEAFHKREGGFADYPADEPIRYLNMTCGGCCGRATLRKLSNLFKLLGKRSDIKPEEVVLHFSSCICKESFHGPKCPHYDYLKELVERKNLLWREGTRISDQSESRRDSLGRWSREV